MSEKDAITTTPSETPPKTYTPAKFVYFRAYKRGQIAIECAEPSTSFEGGLELTLASANGRQTKYVFGSNATAEILRALGKKVA
jgi:hypothetical protein